MTRASKKLGNKGEKQAVIYLKKKDYQILETNYNCNIGEIDIIAKDGDYIVLVEVKTKNDESYGLAKEMVNIRKQKKLIMLAKYIQTEFNHESVRIDVVGIDLKNNSIEHIINAVSNF